MNEGKVIYEGIGKKYRLKGWKGTRKDGTGWKVIIPERDRSEMKEDYV